MKPFSPREELEYILRYWWLVALLAIWGGAVGWLVHSLRPPVYEARTVFTISIDFPEDFELTQYEEDLAIGVASSVVASTPVMERVVQEAQAQGIDIDMLDLWERVSLERRLASWTLIIRDPDPQAAATLANLFVGHGLEALAEAHRTALQARSLQLQIDSLNACLAGSEESPSEFCSQMTSEEIQHELQRLNEELAQEMLASQGVLPFTVFGLSQEATPPAAPAQFGRNTMVFAGGMIGFVLGVIAVNLRLPERLAELRQLRENN